MLLSTARRVGSSELSGMRCVVCMMVSIEVALEIISVSSEESNIIDDRGYDCTLIIMYSC